MNAFFDNPGEDRIEWHGAKLIVIWLVETSQKPKAKSDKPKDNRKIKAVVCYFLKLLAFRYWLLATFLIINTIFVQ
jgi:hypothetical protein